MSGSRPARARGLKQREHIIIVFIMLVAPRAGAWIETIESSLSSKCVCVAPRAGAWIETYQIQYHAQTVTSRPARARGLKHVGELGFFI